ncbi:hypothetical protein COBT_000337 [Conglomerata obtusa]
MNLSSKTSQFIYKFRQNLHDEIKKNEELTKCLTKLSHINLKFQTNVLHSKYMLCTTKAILTPLKISDEIIKLAIRNQLAIAASDFIRNKIYRAIKVITIPQTYLDKYIPVYYGCNKFFEALNIVKKNKQESNINKKSILYNYFNCNRDERSIMYLENDLIPNIFFNKNYTLSDEKSNALIEVFYDCIRNKTKIKRHNVHVIKCIDYRGAESDGYNDEEEIGIGFNLQMSCIYLDEIIKKKYFEFKCFMKFDSDDKILSFDFQEV